MIKNKLYFILLGLAGLSLLLFFLTLLTGKNAATGPLLFAFFAFSSASLTVTSMPLM